MTDNEYDFKIETYLKNLESSLDLALDCLNKLSSES